MQFVNAYKQHGFGFGLYADEAYWPLHKRCSTTLTRMHKTVEDERKTRVMPEPDPDRPEEETMWMTSEQIQDEALKDSTNWIQAGSGELGTLYFELIGCDNLPDMDSVVPGDGNAMTCVKIDSFACIVYEDSVVNTDVIPNCSSPRWMPWTYRAFKFQMSHPATDVLLGIFDHDNAYNPAQVVSRVTGVSKLHDAAGRVVIELSKLQPDTTYVLTYPLYYGGTEEDRKTTKGTVTVRLRMEFPSLRRVLLTALSPPKNNVVAMRKKSQWSVAQYTAHGAVDNEKFSIGTMTRYIEELEGYLDLLETLRNALWHIWLWRGHCKISFGGRTFDLPLHSITAYIWAIKLSWNYDLLPSFIFFSIGWIMLASLEQVNGHPSRWHRSPLYTDFLRRLIWDTSAKEKVESGENAEAIQRYDEQIKQKQEDRKKKRKLEQAEQLKIQKEVEARMKEAEKAETSGFDKTEGFFGLNLRPLKPILYPYQKMMRGYIQTGRMAKNIVLWYESYYAFWLTTIAFVLSTVSYFIPWSFVLTWSFRVIVIVGLGPWMKIVDMVCFRADPNLSVEEQEEAFAQHIQARYEETLQSTDFYQIRSERANKLNDMRQFMFGMHLLRVPMLHTDIVFDVPTPASSAEPVFSAASAVPVKHRKFGQFLEGDMIPKREVELQAEKAHTVDPSMIMGERMFSQAHRAAGAAVGTAVGMPTKLAGNVAGVFRRVGRKALKMD
uniref:C2 domain-containing protein n=1 Tax=Amphora coffeiformis TaxID=265554 RepID=A0A7S3P546_9STRA